MPIWSSLWSDGNHVSSRVVALAVVPVLMVAVALVLVWLWRRRPNSSRLAGLRSQDGVESKPQHKVCAYLACSTAV